MWKKAEIPTSAQRLQQEGYSKLTALVMANAGVENKEQAEEFLHRETVHDPAKIRNIEKVSEIIWDHIYRKEKICVFGDYDCCNSVPDAETTRCRCDGETAGSDL